jgi:hypothetical protein
MKIKLKRYNVLFKKSNICDMKTCEVGETNCSVWSEVNVKRRT